MRAWQRALFIQRPCARQMMGSYSSALGKYKRARRLLELLLQELATRSKGSVGAGLLGSARAVARVGDKAPGELAACILPRMPQCGANGPSAAFALLCAAGVDPSRFVAAVAVPYSRWRDSQCTARQQSSLSVALTPREAREAVDEDRRTISALTSSLQQRIDSVAQRVAIAQ